MASQGQTSAPEGEKQAEKLSLGTSLFVFSLFPSIFLFGLSVSSSVVLNFVSANDCSKDLRAYLIGCIVLGYVFVLYYGLVAHTCCSRSALLLTRSIVLADCAGSAHQVAGGDGGHSHRLPGRLGRLERLRNVGSHQARPMRTLLSVRPHLIVCCAFVRVRCGPCAWC